MLTTSDVLKNVCNEKEVPFFIIKSNGDEQFFYEKALRLNDIGRQKKLRLTEMEIRLAAKMIKHIVEHGPIINNKEKYDKLIELLVDEGYLGRKSWGMMTKNLRDKGFLSRSQYLYTVSITPTIFKILSFKKISLYIEL